MACDWILAAEYAVFGQPEVNLGIPPGFGGTQRLPRRIGSARALELLIDRAPGEGRLKRLRIGLANHVYPADELRSRRACELARTSQRKGPAAVRLVKQAVQRGPRPRSLSPPARWKQTCSPRPLPP